MEKPHFWQEHIDAKLVGAVCKRLEKEETQHWADEKQPARCTINYGWNFVALESGEKQFIDLPEEIASIRSAVHDVLRPQLATPSAPEDFDNVIVTIYGQGEAIVPHIDRDGRHESGKNVAYHFGETILGVILQADSTGRLKFIRHHGEGKPLLEAAPYMELNEKSGLAFLFQGKLRHFPYFHAVSTVTNLRMSITFRTTHFTAV